ncbi:ABC transporter ATP-binding protein [Aureliella helgolandensis]|uniref:ABC transporter ATP-binding protein YtrE n=1 Tax=Aureliella helgolandensis TaxID=2527968 RepID=A0A518GE62_9BACT|nr:ABC transporter ATP-binding protein [Aureliella helgolandensis]QDV26847.1 ABC transporter ATP-binding protein YtrE [Aureliella helgolandensis]
MPLEPNHPPEPSNRAIPATPGADPDYFAAFRIAEALDLPEELGPTADFSHSPKPPTDAQTAVIRAVGIDKSYMIGDQRCPVLRDVHFATHAGECVFLSGPSGGGKSTLLAILGCLLQPDQGQVFLSGRRADQLTPQQLAFLRRDNIGFVFQRFQLIRGLTAMDNVALPLTLQGQSLPDARTMAADLLRQVGLEQHLRALPTAMSPGQCQRVALARGLITRPQLLLADEPTAALDAKSGLEVMELLRELVHQTGAAAVVVTHDPRIHHFADRICEMENGSLRT